MLLYRGGSKLKYPDGLYSRRQMFGGLPPYKQTLNDLLSTLKRKHKKFSSLLSKEGYSPDMFNKSHDKLKFAWNPIKVNSKGTLEYRGGDMNYLSNIIGVSTMLKFALRKIQQDYLIVVPYDIDPKDSFKVEKNIIFIPPHSVVRKAYQPRSAFNGLKDERIHTYAKAFFKFINKNTFKEYRPLLKPIKKMIDEKETVSDKILKYAQKKGYANKLDQDFSKEMALHFADKYSKDVLNITEKMRSIESL
jgi:hypothetical protein